MDLFRLETIIGAAKLVLMSMGIITSLFLFKVAVIPCAFDFLLSTFPRFWLSARTWFSPPFVYIIVNFIIITIAASSNFHHHYKTIPFPDSPPSESDPKHPTATAAAADVITDYAVSHQSEPEKQSNDPKEEENSNPELEDSASSGDNSGTDPSPEKCGNDYESPDSDDTLDATWKAIMEGQGRTATPQLKKSDTWGARIAKAEALGENYEDGEDDPVAWARRELRKSETFNDTASLRREKSISSEELKRRAEAFIEKFNMEIKLQRLESQKRFKEMVNRGVYCG